MRIATIDMGTNTFLLLVADVDAQGVQPVHQEQQVVRLGKGVDQTGALNPEAMQRGIDCLRHFAEMARKHGAETIVACGTSALRDAANSPEFLRRVRQETGIEPQVISGDQEAAYSYFGSLSNKAYLPGPFLLLDIGGGSSEICWGDHSKLQGKISLDIGSVRLTERHAHHDPVLPEEVQAMRRAISRKLAEVDHHLRGVGPHTLIAVAGTVTTLAAMHGQVEPYDSDRIDGSRLARTDVSAIAAELVRRSIEERKQLVGLPASRADVILAGALILEEFMRHTGKDELVVSDRGVRFGSALDSFRQQMTKGA